MTYLSLPFITLSGGTPGSVSGETVELTPNLILKNGEAFTLTVQCVAVGASVTQGFIQHFSVRRDSNITTIASSDTLDQFGDPSASSWTLTASVGTGPDRFRLVFSTGSTVTAACECGHFLDTKCDSSWLHADTFQGHR